MAALQEKQIRVVTIILGIVTAVLIGIIGFRLMSDSLVRAEDISPQNVAITEITQNSVRVKWSTQRETQSVIEYGTTPTSLTFFAPEAVKTKTHSVELNLLSGATTYYFQIRTADKKFDNGGVPWTFTTLSSDQQASITPGTEETVSTDLQPTSDTNAVTIFPSATTAVNVSKDTACVLAEYKVQFNTANKKYDQDDNGTVNFRDWSLCNAKNGLLAPSSTPTPTVSITPTVTPTPTP